MNRQETQKYIFYKVYSAGKRMGDTNLKRKWYFIGRNWPDLEVLIRWSAMDYEYCWSLSLLFRAINPR